MKKAKCKVQNGREAPRSQAGRGSLFSILTFALFTLTFSLSPVKAEVSAEASLSSSQVGTGEPFQLTVQVTSDERSDQLPWPEVEGLDKFAVTKSSGTTHKS